MVAKQTGIPLGKLNSTEREKLVNGEELKGSYVGAMPQDDLEDWVNDRI